MTTIGADLDLLTVLQHIVAAATSLADARYGALGILDPSGTYLTDFLTVGIDDETRATIGELPKGHGILGLLISDPAATAAPRPPGASRELRLPAGPSADARRSSACR